MTKAWNKFQDFDSISPGMIHGLDRGHSLFQVINSDSRRMFWGSDAEYVKIVLELREYQRGRRLFGMSQVESGAVRAVFHALRMSRHFREVSPSEADLFFPVLDRINGNIKAELGQKRGFPGGEQILPLSRVRGHMADMTGHKAAQLGEVRERLGFAVPDGFVITAGVFEMMLYQGSLLEDINKIKMEMLPDDLESIRMTGEDIRNLILSAPLPKELEHALEQAAARLVNDHQASGVAPVHLVLRGSLAGQEDGLTFPGLCPPVLNVPAEVILRAYREVLAGLYTPEAMVYRLLHGVREEDMAMAVICQPMVRAVAGGTIYTRHPFDANRDGVHLAAVRGSSWSMLKGLLTPDLYVVSRNNASEALETVIARKTQQLVGGQDGMTMIDVPESEHDLPVLDSLQVEQLAGFAMQAEEHFQGPREVEWLMDEGGFFWVVQTRAINMMFASAHKAVALKEDVNQEKPLVARGDALSPGLDWGRLWREQAEPDCQEMHQDCILNVLGAQTALIQALPWVRGLVVQQGSLFCHLAVAARESGVPMIRVDVGGLPLEFHGDVILDGGRGTVSSVRWPERDVRSAKQKINLTGTPVHRALRRVMELIAPGVGNGLNIMDINPAHCRTLHQVVRFLRDFSFQEVLRDAELILSEAKSEAVLRNVGPDRHLCVHVAANEEYGQESDARGTRFAHAAGSLLLESLSRGVGAGIEACGKLSFVKELEMLSSKQGEFDRLVPAGYVFQHRDGLIFCARIATRFAVLQVRHDSTSQEHGIVVFFENTPAHASTSERGRLLQRALAELDFFTQSFDDCNAAVFSHAQSEAIQERLQILGGLLALLHY